MIRRFLVPVAIVVLFLVGSYFIVKPFVARVFAGRGDYAAAIALEPLNAAYHAAVGKEALEKAKASGNEALYEEAARAYEKAVELCPHSSKYRIGLGESQAMVLAKRGMIPALVMDAYVDNLKKAVQYNPNYYFTNAAAGYYLLLMRGRLTQEDRNFAIYRLRYALELNSDYRNQVFSSVVNGLGDYGILQRITPRTPVWQGWMMDFLRDIDRWKYKR